MKQNYFQLIAFTFFSILINISCTEEIDLDLQSSKPTLVIEANIFDEAGPYFIKLSKSQAYDANNDYQKIEGATLVIDNNEGNIDTLTPVIGSPGLYQTQTTAGVAGKTYTFRSLIEGKTYQAICRMPAAVAIDTLILIDNPFGGGGFGGQEPEGNGKVLVVGFRDPAGIENHYYLTVTKNGAFQKNFYVYRDRARDGKLFGPPLFGFTFDNGDTLDVTMQSITKEIYNYYDVLQDISGGSAFGAPQAPANPPTNITPTSLGYFNAAGITRKSIIIPE